MSLDQIMLILPIKQNMASVTIVEVAGHQLVKRLSVWPLVRLHARGGQLECSPHSVAAQDQRQAPPRALGLIAPERPGEVPASVPRPGHLARQNDGVSTGASSRAASASGATRSRRAS